MKTLTFSLLLILTTALTAFGQERTDETRVTVNPETFDVFVDGELATCEPAKTLPLTQRYMLR